MGGSLATECSAKSETATRLAECGERGTAAIERREVYLLVLAIDRNESDHLLNLFGRAMIYSVILGPQLQLQVAEALIASTRMLYPVGGATICTQLVRLWMFSDPSRIGQSKPPD